MHTETTPEGSSRALFFGMIFASACFLSIFSASLFQLLNTFFDYYISFVVVGAAIAGWSLSQALDCWPKSKKPSEVSAKSSAVYLAVSGFTAALVLLALFLLPAGSASYIFLSILIVAFYLCGTRGITLIVRQSALHTTTERIALLAGLIGLLIAPILIDVSSGPIAVAWLTALGLMVAAALTARHLAPAVLSVGTLFVLTGGALMSHWNPYILPAMTTKPFATVRVDGAFPTKHVARWDSSWRVDSVPLREGEHTILWSYTDLNAPVLIPVSAGRDSRDADWLRERFPLVAFPFLAFQPAKVLTIAPLPGPETAIAVNAGVSDARVLAYNSTAEQVFASLRNEGLIHALGKSAHGNVQRTLKTDATPYDLIFMPITHLGRSGWIGSTLAENNLYTREAVNTYMSHLAPHGVLAITTLDELLFVKTLLMAREALIAPPADTTGHAVAFWGARLVDIQKFQDPYRYLLIIAKDPDIEAMASRLSTLSRSSAVEFIFGPGVQTPKGSIYSVLQQPLSTEKIREIFAASISQRIGLPVNLESATTAQPFFFQILADMHPWPKLLVAVCLFALLAVSIFPLSDRRGLQSADSSLRPPLPLYLGCFAFLGAMTGMAAIGAVERFSVLTGATAWVSVATIAGMLAGLMSGAGMAKKIADRIRWIGTHIALLLLTGVLYVTTTYWTGSLDLFAPGVIGLTLLCLLLLLGMTIGLVLRQAMQWQQEMLPELVPWAWIAYGLAAPIGVFGVHWIAQSWGWGTAWAVMAAATMTTLIVGLWVWSPRYLQHGTNGTGMAPVDTASPKMA